MFWIDAPVAGRLAIAARPRAGDWLGDEINAWRSASVDVVVSLLEPHEVHELGLEAESETCIEAGIAFIAFAIPDRESRRRWRRHVSWSLCAEIGCRRGTTSSFIVGPA